MRVLFLINNLRGGGAEKLLTDIVNNLDPCCYDITICTIEDDGLYRDQLKSHIHYKSIIKKPNRIKFGLFWRFVKFFPAKFVYRFCIKDRYDVEVAFLEGLSTEILSGSTGTGKKIAWVHTDMQKNNYTQVYFTSKKSHRICYESYDSIICVSKMVKSQFIKEFGNLSSLKVIINFIDIEQIRYKANKKLSLDISDASVPVVCSVGRLNTVKGYDRLLRVHEKLLKEGFFHKLWIIGDGPEREELERFILKNNLQNTVTLWGFYENPYPFVKNADIFVCSSLVEGYPLAVAEALALGKPIVSTYCTGTSEILAEGRYGMLTENSEDGLYQGLREILIHKSSFDLLCEKAKEGAKSFEPKKVISKIEELFI